MSIFDQMVSLDTPEKEAVSQKKPNIVIFTHVATFLDDIVADLMARGHEVRLLDYNTFDLTDKKTLLDTIQWADICWFEFCHEVTLQLINQNLHKFNKKVVMRWHRFEIAEHPFPERVNWDFVDDLILVSDEMRKLLLKRAPDAQNKTRIHLIPNGLNISKFTPSSSLDMKKISFVAKPLIRKNHSLVMQIMFELVKRDPAYEIHIAGTQEPNVLQPYMDKMARKMGIERNVFFHGWIDDMDEFYKDKGVLLSTSLHESFGYGIAEAMAMGAYPVVHDYVGAEEFWPEEILFCSIDDAVDKILSAQPHKWIEYAKKFDLQKQCDDMAAVFAEPLSETNKTSQISATIPEVDRSNFNSSQYWEQRYQKGGNSGVGSYNELAQYKADILNTFVKEHNVTSVAELGSGDGNQLKYYEFPKYAGFDVAETVVKRCRNLFSQNQNYSFYWLLDPELKIDDHYDLYDMTMSIDVIYHLVEDSIFEDHMHTLFKMAKSYVIIYASNKDTENHRRTPHVRHRKFTDFIDKHYPDWQLLEHIDNPHKELDKCPSDFFIFHKKSEN